MSLTTVQGQVHAATVEEVGAEGCQDTVGFYQIEEYFHELGTADCQLGQCAA